MRSAIRPLSDSKALMEAFTSAKDYRDSLTLHANGTLKQVYELYMDLLDEAAESPRLPPFLLATI